MLPFLNPTNKKSKKFVVAFKGLNYGEGYEDGEFSDTKNISLDEFPCLTQRTGRVWEKNTYSAATSVCYKDGKFGGVFVVNGNNVIRNGSSIANLSVTIGKKQMVGVGNYLIIFPDKVYYNVETGESGSMDVEEKYMAKVTSQTIELVKTEGYPMAFAFSKGDTVEISGIPGYFDESNPKSATIREWEPEKLTFDANAFTANSTAAKITIKRTVPELEYICESNYRLWGVKDNTIYGSKYMDPLNFQSFDGSAGDSYAIDVGTDGDFTGCIPYTSHICFFKENVLHKLYGSKPSNFQLVNSQVYGVQKGSERSMCIINETLYYKGVNGVYAYTGGIPNLVSDKFGMKRFHSACATTDGSKYYIGMCEEATVDKEPKHGVYVYDTRKNLWLQEDDFNCVDMAFDGQSVLLLESNNMYYVLKGEVADTLPWADEPTPIEWSVTFCPFNEVMNERKGYSKFHLRLDLSEGASVDVEIKRNTDTQWQNVYTISDSNKAQTVTVPILPARCDSVEIRLSGTGVCKLRTFIREFYVGSDV